jgi:hypothetical protein
MRLKLGIAVAAFALTRAPSIAQAPHAGSIRGLVLTEDGKPLANATVYGLRELDMTHQLRTTTDDKGQFLLEKIPAGSIYLLAFKESDWYPYNFFAFFAAGAGKPTTVAVEGGKTTENRAIHMGPRAGALNLDIVDVNGATVSDGVNLIFTRDGMPGDYQRGGGGYPILVPTVPFRLTVEAPGYQPWHSGVIKPESTKTLDIAVQMKPL